MTTAIILSAGKGLRLRPLTELIPKCFVMVCGKPIVQWEIEHLKQHGFDDIYVVVSEDYYESLGSMREFYGARILYQPSPKGTLSTLKYALQKVKVKGDFLLVQNGDIISDVNLSVHFKAFKEMYYRNHEVTCGIIVKKLKTKYGIVEYTGTCAGHVTAFYEKPELPYYINAGYYFFTKDIIDIVREYPSEGDLERSLLPSLAREMRMIAIRADYNYWFAIDTFKDVIEASKYLMKLREKEK